MNKEQDFITESIKQGRVGDIKAIKDSDPSALVFSVNMIKGIHEDEFFFVPLHYAIKSRNIEITKLILSAYSDSRLIEKCLKDSKFVEMTGQSGGRLLDYYLACQPFGNNILVSILDSIEDAQKEPFFKELISAIYETKFPYVDRKLLLNFNDSPFTENGVELNKFEAHKAFFSPLLDIFSDDVSPLERKVLTTPFEAPDVFVSTFFDYSTCMDDKTVNKAWAKGLYESSKLKDIQPIVVSNYYKQPGLDRLLAIFDENVAKKVRLEELFEECSDSIPSSILSEMMNLLGEGQLPYPDECHPFYVARNNPDIIRLLLDNGMDPNFTERHGQTFLGRYGDKISKEVYKLFIDAGANLYHTTDEDYRYQDCPIATLIENNDVELVKYFLETQPENVSFQYEGEDGKKYGGLLHIALKNSDGSKDEMVELLLSHGAEPDAINEIEC